MSPSEPLDVKVKFNRCCLCGGDIRETATDPCLIWVETKGMEGKRGPWQAWVCHGDCFKKCLAQPADCPEEFAPVHF